MALSADHGSSSVMWQRRRWLATRLSACSDTPVLAASEMIAMSLSPHWKDSRSFMFIIFWLVSVLTWRFCVTTWPVAASRTRCALRPVISATLSGPPQRSTRWSSGLGGSCSASTASNSRSRTRSRYGLRTMASSGLASGSPPRPPMPMPPSSMSSSSLTTAPARPPPRLRPRAPAPAAAPSSSSSSDAMKSSSEPISSES
mmetsp:Transcript_31322/g.78485  ORF Transcript_31322/g.78485 Transcript_31322/m.78485 type:complete len:201 (+) Transcript_31322:1322-1924(+)